MNEIKPSEVNEMTNEQFNTGRNDLIELMIEKAKRIITDEAQLKELIAEYQELEH